MSIQVSQISKSFGEVQALQDISLEVKPGELFGLIGPDGAGKTTLIRILATLLLADQGTAKVADWDVVKDFRKLRKHIGYMPGRFSLYQDLTVLENLQFFATIFGTTIEANYGFIKDIYHQIEPFKHRKAGQLSGGMKQKLALSCALIHQPQVLFLDEPTTGVDAVSRKEFWEMLKKLKAKNITILVSTPYMDEASICDRVALIQKGQLMAIDTPTGVVDAFEKPLFAVRAKNMYQLIQDIRKYSGTLTAFPFGTHLHVTTATKPAIDQLEDFLLKKGHEEIEILPVSPTIEDCFMELMQTT
jgi:ABC-2 type transport system ATP-binding protein